MAAAARSCSCNVPGCSTSGRRQPYLSFHAFPTDETLRKSWVRLIRRDEGPSFKILWGSTFVCSLHFDKESIYVLESGRKRLKANTTPTRFPWNNWGDDQPRRRSVFDRVNTRLGVAEGVQADAESAAEENDQSAASNHEPASDHNYAHAGVVDAAAVQTIRLLEAKVRDLEGQLRDLSCILNINRYCATDDEFRFYTRFPSEKVFWSFWKSIAPSASRLVYWSRAQRTTDVMGLEKPSPNRRLQLVDELFLYCCRVAVGMKEKVIADIFGISTTTVSRVIITWANYLFLVLGSEPIWMTRERVQATMPTKFAQYCPNVRVILDCTEIRCEAPSSLTLQSETFSNYKNTNTFKGLIGIAPCRVITFISKLYTGSISDREITQQSGILHLLQPGDACMADKGFVIDNMLSEVGATLIIPPFKRGTRFSRRTPKTQSIAST
ncbi:hypothetical protein UPYG_G00112140 [Umbra pygmaea]|uniref:THAP-type domain-containing protein n=1 Tax=Umbra pygmaea TaxID=75934 RepID=A0ABD0X782_UMBPY